MSEADTSDDGADLDSGYHASFTAVSGDGTTVQGQAESGVKAGTLAGGNGVWGAGNTCLFALTVEQLPNLGCPQRGAPGPPGPGPRPLPGIMRRPCPCARRNAVLSER